MTALTTPESEAIKTARPVDFAIMPPFAAARPMPAAFAGVANSGSAASTPIVKIFPGVLRASAPIVDDTSVGLELHSFWTAATDDRRDPAPEDRLLGGNDDLGEEIDVWIKHRYNSALGLSLGYSVFFPGDAIRARFSAADAAAEREVRPHGSVAHWAYLMADLHF